MSTDTSWYVYILICKDDSFYTGISIDPEKRLQAHRSGAGAAYTRSHVPVRIVYQELCGLRSTALKREHEIKKLSRKQKEKLILAQIVYNK